MLPVIKSDHHSELDYFFVLSLSNFVLMLVLSPCRPPPPPSSCLSSSQGLSRFCCSPTASTSGRFCRIAPSTRCCSTTWRTPSPWTSTTTASWCSGRTWRWTASWRPTWTAPTWRRWSPPAWRVQVGDGRFRLGTSGLFYVRLYSAAAHFIHQPRSFVSSAEWHQSSSNCFWYLTLIPFFQSVPFLSLMLPPSHNVSCSFWLIFFYLLYISLRVPASHLSSLNLCFVLFTLLVLLQLYLLRLNLPQTRTHSKQNIQRIHK